ncbi:hypothetical protein [Tsuneonella amylolytica]|uniref:hypothetical protein n=1 Tax=Tsuneonella amylolytica TaxID=2338327 RepID=UPI000EA97B2B|nr:hypothetical protein [Tsuneonella amylolytica]
MKTIALAVGAIALFASVPVAAQDAPTGTVTAEEVIADAKAAYGPPDTKAKRACPAPKPGESIVVCAQQEDQSQFRVQSSAQLDPTGAGAKDGVPDAPDVATKYPGVVVATGCFIPPCPPPMPLIIDLAAIPEAPPGSDADRAARGLAPARGRGEEDGVTPPG